MDLKKIPTPSALQVLADRRLRLTLGAANICTPYAGSRDPYAPFTHSGYMHRARLGTPISSEPWVTIRNQQPADLVPVNPFEPSRFRKNGLAIWDAALGIPECRHRNMFLPIKTKETPVVRGGNKYWEDKLVPALSKVGPLGPEGAILRPKDDYILDLTTLGELGYRMRMAAHAMAHMRGDKQDANKRRANDKTKLGGYIAGITGEMAFAYIYGLPFNTALRQDGISAECDFKQYGLEVKTSTQFELPILKIPWKNGEAPRFDHTIAVVDIATFIEPHPYGWTTRTLQYNKRDYWCCSPTIVMIAGWEMVDFITHQPLISSDPGNLNWPVGYGVHPLDLMGPDQLWSYLALAREARGEPIYNQELRDVEEWLYSEDFNKLVAKYPPLPCCIDCISINEKAEGAPKRPMVQRPLKPKIDKVADYAWAQYDKDRNEIRKAMLEPAVKAYEAKFYGTALEANRRRRAQAARYKMERELVNEARILKKALWKKAEGRDLNKTEEPIYQNYCTQARKALDAKKIPQ